MFRILIADSLPAAVLERYNTLEEVDTVVDTLAEVIRDLRKISPLGKEKYGEEV